MPRRRAGTAAIAVIVACSLTQGAAASGAGIERTDETWQTCTSPELEQPFEQFGDNRDYVLAPSGAFEHLDAALNPLELSVDLSSLGWQPRAGAGITLGNEAYHVRRRTDTWSLTLPHEAAATSPAMCVDLHYPHMRLVSRASSSGSTASEPRLRVQVAYPGTARPGFRHVDTLTGTEGSASRQGWRVSEDIPLRPERGGETPGPRLAGLRFTALSGDWRIDDIYVDPRRHR
jgi:hypothetical protein